MSDFKSRYGQVAVVLGSQWGDEGKGKLVDILSQEYGMIGRATGGANAGHTIYFKDENRGGEVTKIVFHLIPSGIMHEGKVCVIGNGVVIHIPTMFGEIDKLHELGISTEGKLLISDRAHIVFDYHKEVDGIQEERKGKNKVGTTKRGIGPAYADKISRVGVRMGDLRDWDMFEAKYRHNLKNYQEMYGGFDYDAEKELAELKEFSGKVLPMVTDTALHINDSLDSGHELLMEGANGMHLDIDHGTYQFVTSSNPSIGGICTGIGLPATKITSVIGIMKAYTTRVGAGPFPSELHDVLGDAIRDKGGEFGSTTGRPRRCGWFDAVVGRYAVMINGLTHINLTKLDVLTGLESIKIAVGYKHGDNSFVRTMPCSLKELEEVEVEYIELPGWPEELDDCQTFEDLPENARNYVLKLEELLGCQIDTIGVGQRRDQLIVR